MNKKDLEKYRKYELNGKTIECEFPCESCAFISQCQRIEKEVLRYKPDVHSFGAELCKSSTVLPFIDTSSEERARKLYHILIELSIAERMKKRWNAFDVAKNLGISLYRVRNRIHYLVDRKFIKLNDKKIYEFSFGRNVHALVKFYCYEFERRFGNVPVVNGSEIGALAALIRDYPEDHLRKMVMEYFELDDDFVKNSGYVLKFFPLKINRILIELSKKERTTISSLTKEQLEEYVKGKEEGKWTGEEDWAKSYEKSLKNLTFVE